MLSSQSRAEAITLPPWAIGGRLGLCLSLWVAVLVLAAASGGATDRILLQAIGLVAALLALTIGPARIWERFRDGGWMLLLPAFLGLLQLVPLPRSWLLVLAPLRAELMPPEQGWAALSLYPFATVDNACLWVVYGLAFVFGGLSARSRLVTVGGSVALVGVALAQAAYGVLGQGLVRITAAQETRFTMARGTFPTRDQFACFLAMIAPLLLASLMLDESGWRRGASRSRPEWFARLTIRALCLAILILGALFSFSRGGLAAMALGFCVVFVAAALRARGSGRRTASLILIVTIAVALAGTSQIVSQWSSMLRPELLQADARWPVWRSAWGVVADHPLLGTGLGTFPTAFLPYARESFGALVMDAHSELIQIAIEIGLPAAVALYGTLLLWILRPARAALRARSGASAVAPIGIAGALAAFVLVSLFDFPFHVPANSLVAFTLAGYAQSLAPALHPRAGGV